MINGLFSGAVPLLLFVAKATLLLVVALVGTMTLRRSTAGARYLVWLAALVGVLALPLLSRIPALQIGILPAATGAITSAPQIVPTSAIPVAPMTPNAPQAPTAPAIVGSELNAPSARIAPAALTTPAAAPIIGTRDAVVASSLIVSPSTSMFSIIAVVWAGVALALLGWLVAGALQVRRIVACARDLTTPDWTTPLCEVADRLDLEAPPRLVISDRIEMAFACRAFAPTIVLPAAAEEWTDDRRRAVLFHELSHVKRHDLLGHTLGRVACALYWFHPLVWTAAKNLRNESERACDDLVLSCGARPSEYAQHLLDMVTSVRRHGAPVMALPMARKKEFEGRMLAILDPAIRRASPGRAQSALVVATLGMLSLCVAAVSPAASTRVSSKPATLTALAPSARSAPFAPIAQSDSPGRGERVVPQQADVPVETLNTLRTETHVDRQVETQIDFHNSQNADARVNIRGNSLNSIIANATAMGLRSAGLTLGGISRSRPLQADTGRVLVLMKVLSTDTDAEVRRTAAWALHDIATAGSKTSLLRALHSDTDPSVREMAAWALAEYESADVTAGLADALVHDKSSTVRRTSAWALGSIDKSGQTDALITGASDSSVSVREVAIWALGTTDVQRAPMAVMNALSDNAPRIRTVAAWALGEIGDSTAVRSLVRAFESESESSVRMAELHSLSVLARAPSSVIDIAMKSSDPELRRRGVEMLAGNEQPWPWPWPWPWPRPTP